MSTPHAAEPDPALVDRLLKFRMWEKAQPGSRPVDHNFWPWFRDKLRRDPRERAQTEARLQLHEAHLSVLKNVREAQALAAKPIPAEDYVGLRAVMDAAEARRKKK